MADEELIEKIRKVLKELKPLFKEHKDDIEAILEHLRKRNPKNPDVQWIWNMLNRSEWIGKELAIYNGGYEMYGHAFKQARKSIKSKLAKFKEYSPPGPKPPESFYKGTTDQYGTPWSKSLTRKAHKLREAAKREAKRKKIEDEERKKRKEKVAKQYTPEARAKRKKRAKQKQKSRKTVDI